MSKRLFFAVLLVLMPLFICSCSGTTVHRDIFSFTLDKAVVQKSIQGHRKLPQSQFDYQIFVPQLQPKHPMRFILVLHGAGEKNADYLLKWKKEAAKHQTIVIAPQLEWPVPLTTEYLEHFMAFINELSQKYPVDPNRIYVAGASAGGAVGLHLAVEHPDRFRGAIMISSLGFDQCLRTEKKLEKIKDYKSLPPLLFVHGMKDTVLFETVLNGIDFLIDHGVKPQLYSYENAGHEHRPEWNKRIFEWIETVEEVPGPAGVTGSGN